MAGFISAYVEGCDKCQRYRKDIHPKAQIQPQEVPEGPWQLVGVDLIGPLPLSKGKDMILNIVDHYTKQIHLFPVTSQIMADGVASIYFEQVFPLHGIPKKIISDRGPQFVARSMQALYKRLGIDAGLTTAYHPQANGQVECYVFTLTKLHHKQHYYWTASFLYRDPTSPHSCVYDLEVLSSTIQGLVSLYVCIGDPRTIITVRLYQYLARYHLFINTY